MLPVILAVALAAANSFADDELDCGRERCARARGRAAAPASAAIPNFAAFEFAPANGTGMGTACACTTPTGVHGEVLTFTRASAATCFKHSQTTGIANGDLVTCASGQPRVMPGGDGTGVLGLFNEGTRTNDMLWSNDITNAAWPAEGGGNDCTKTADAAVGPNGSTTADRVQCASTGAGVYQAINQIAVTHNPASVSTFLRGNGTSGTVDVCTSGGAYTCSPCTFVPGSWTRCYRENVNIAGGRIYIGNMTALNGGTARGAADFFIAKSQSEAGAFASSPIDTTTAAVTRAVEIATLPFMNGATSGSFASTFVAEGGPSTPPGLTWGNDTDHAILELGTAGPTYSNLIDARAATSQYTFYNPTLAIGGTYGISLPNVEYGTSAYWTGGGTSFGLYDATGSLVTGSGAANFIPTTLIELGTYSTNANLFGVIKKVCADPSSTRCR